MATNEGIRFKIDLVGLLRSVGKTQESELSRVIIEESATQIEKLERLKQTSYPGMCQNGHIQIGFRMNDAIEAYGTDEMCPVCYAIAEKATKGGDT